MMKKHIEQVYASKKTAEEEAKLWQEYFGYDYEITEEIQQGRKYYRLVMHTDQNLMG